MMDFQDEDALRDILISWYGPQAQHWPMSESMLNVVIKIIDEIHNCTATMHFVPHPVGPGNAISQLTKSYVKKLLAVARDNSKVYLSCARSTILRYKTDVHMAAEGL
jgi:hypothetical protein